MEIIHVFCVTNPRLWGKIDSAEKGMIQMFIIAGLGNPSKKYERTRHNAGFEVIDRISEKYNISVDTKKHLALTGKGIIENQKVLLVKPQTYMNLSGESIRSAVDFYKADAAGELIVIYDDVALAPGQLRIREKGSAGGHNGMKNIIACLGTQEFTRIRVGVGEKPDGYDLADYVLGHFTRAEREQMEEGYDRAADAVRLILSGDTGAAMSIYNRKVE